MSFGAQRSAKNRRATRQFDACATDNPTTSTRSISLYGSASVHFLAPTTDSVSAAMQILDAANSLNFIISFIRQIAWMPRSIPSMACGVVATRESLVF
jgi:hypothetical protein